jgi:subtilisin family serine protease
MPQIQDPPPDPGPSYDELKVQYESNYEYQQQYGLALTNASSAYARGATGKNVTIGITDSGLDVSHVEIDGTRVNPGSYLSYSNYTPNTHQKRHGTMVASVAAGILSENSDTPMHGVAFDADIFFVAIQLAEPDDTYEPIDLGDGSGGEPDPDFSGVDNFFENLFEVYTSRNIDIVNNSYGYSGNIIDYSEEVVRNAFPKTIAAIAQTGS